MLIKTEELARRLGRSPAAVTHAARAGRFGKTAHRGERGVWLFDSPSAEREFRANTDPSRLSAEHQLARPAAQPPPEPDDDRVGPEFVKYLAWLQAAVLKAPDLDESDRFEIAGIFQDKVTNLAPSQLDDWQAGRIAPEREF